MSKIDNFPDISFIENTDVETVFNEMISDYQDKYKELTGESISLAQADPYRLIMYACTMQIYQAMQYADFAGKQSLLKYSSGDYLDNLAALRGIERRPATSATATFEFSIEAPLASAVAIPAGCRISNGNDLEFATDEYAEIPAGSTSVVVNATCVEAGVQGNDFAPGEISKLVNVLPYIAAVRNTVTTFGGADIETDSELKERIYTVENTYSTAGPVKAYEYYAKLADTSISDAYVTSSEPGVVDIYIMSEDGQMPSQALLDKVAEYLSDDTIRPLTDNVQVHAPTPVDYDVELTYFISASDAAAVTSIQTEVETAVSIYNTWQTEKIGRDINPSYLVQKVMDAGAKRVQITSPQHLAIGEGCVAKLDNVNIIYGGIEDD